MGGTEAHSSDLCAVQPKASVDASYQTVLQFPSLSTEVQNIDKYVYAIVPRRKVGSHFDQRQPVRLTKTLLSKYFDAPLTTVAKELVSAV